jgi:hypothetical protein
LDVGGWAFGAVVERAVVVGAVTVRFTVSDVVLDVVGDKVGEREPVVRGDEIDGCQWAAIGGKRVA